MTVHELRTAMVLIRLNCEDYDQTVTVLLGSVNLVNCTEKNRLAKSEDIPGLIYRSHAE